MEVPIWKMLLRSSRCAAGRSGARMVVYASAGNDAVRSASANALYHPYSSEDVPKDGPSNLKWRMAHFNTSAISCGDAVWSFLSKRSLGLSACFSFSLDDGCSFRDLRNRMTRFRCSVADCECQNALKMPGVSRPVSAS